MSNLTNIRIFTANSNLTPNNLNKIIKNKYG